MSSIYDALKRLQEDGKVPEYVPVHARPGKGKRMGAILIVAVLCSSLATGMVYHFWASRHATPASSETATAARKPQPQNAPAPAPLPAPDPANLLAQAQARRSAGDRQAAIELYQRCLEASPAISKDAYAQLGGLYFEHHELEHAMITYQKALTYFKNDAVLLNNLGGVLLAKGDIEGAMGYFRLASNVSKDYVEPVYNLACAYARKGNRTAALDALNKAMHMHPDVRRWAEGDPDLESLKGSWPVNAIEKGE